MVEQILLFCCTTKRFAKKVADVCERSESNQRFLPGFHTAAEQRNWTREGRRRRRPQSNFLGAGALLPLAGKATNFLM